MTNTEELKKMIAEMLNKGDYTTSMVVVPIGVTLENPLVIGKYTLEVVQSAYIPQDQIFLVNAENYNHLFGKGGLYEGN